MSYRLSKQAQADLISIFVSGVRDFGVVQAEAYQDRIDRTIELIANNPNIARERREINPPVRIHPVKAHVIVYVIDDSRGVHILRVRHSRENWPASPIS